MNCSDISSILDDCDIRLLNDSLRESVHAHIEVCSDCARDWNLHTRLVTRSFPELPSDLVADCRAITEIRQTAMNRRKTWPRSRLTFGFVALVAAAAALALHPDAEINSVAAAPSPEAGIVPPDGNLVTETLSSSPSLQEPHSDSNTPNIGPNPGSAFSVHLSITPNDTLTPVDESEFNIWRTAAIDELRRTPGLALVLDEPSTSEQGPDFEVTLSIARQNNQLNGRMNIKNTRSSGVVLPLRGGVWA